ELRAIPEGSHGVTGFQVHREHAAWRNRYVTQRGSASRLLLILTGRKTIRCACPKGSRVLRATLSCRRAAWGQRGGCLDDGPRLRRNGHRHVVHAEPDAGAWRSRKQKNLRSRVGSAESRSSLGCESAIYEENQYVQYRTLTSCSGDQPRESLSR